MPKKVQNLPTPTLVEAIAPEFSNINNPINITFTSAANTLRAFDIAEYFAKKNSGNVEENDLLIEFMTFSNGVKKSIQKYLQEASAPTETPAPENIDSYPDPASSENTETPTPDGK